MIREKDWICSGGLAFQSFSSRFSVLHTDSPSWSRHDRSLHILHTLSFPSLSLSVKPPGALNVTISQPLRTICHLLSTPSRPLSHPTNRVRNETRRDETRRGQAGPVETVRDARHRTTPTCGLRRRSSRHHRSPPNLGTTTQLSAQQRQRQGIVNRLSRTVPLRVRAPVWTNSFSSWPTRPTHTGSSTVGSTYYLPTFCTRGRPCVCRAAARLGTAEAATTARGAG